ncbi:hypothetical protein N2152v2_003213 [Parachlorella kessleri]
MDPPPAEGSSSLNPSRMEVVLTADASDAPLYQPLPQQGSPGPLSLDRSILSGAAASDFADSQPASPSGMALLHPFTLQSTDDPQDSPSVSVTVLPEGLAGSLPSNKQQLPSLSTRFPSGGSGSSGSTTIRAHYFTGSAAKRRSSAANIIRQQHLASPHPSLVVRDKLPSFFPAELSSGEAVLFEVEGEGQGTDTQQGEGDGPGKGGAPAQDKKQASVFDLLERRDKERRRWQVAITFVLDGVSYTLVSLVITLMVLYSDDLRTAAAPPSADAGFRNFTIFCLAFFAAELLLSSAAKPRYFLGFYFLIDCVATASLLFDIPDFMALLTGDHAGSGAAGTTSLGQVTSEGQSNLRAARIAQVIRVVRLIRIVKLYKIYAQNRHRLQGGGGAMVELQTGEKQTRVGEKLSELTIRKVIIMVLALLFLLPLFEPTVGWYGSAPTLDKGGLELLHAMYGTEGNSSAFGEAVQAYTDETPWRLGSRRTSSLISLFIYNASLYEDPGVAARRDSEVTSALAKVTSALAKTPECSAGPPDQCFISAAVFDTKWFSQVQGLPSLMPSLEEQVREGTCITELPWLV